MATIKKFKVGDKVKVIGNTNGSSNQLGDIGVITKISESTWDAEYWVDCGRGGSTWTLEDEMVHLADANKVTKYKCKICGKQAITSNADDINLCEKHYESVNSFSYERDQKNTPTGGSTKGIVQSSRTFGVELECTNKHRLRFLLGLSLVPKEWGLKSDGSVGGRYPREVVTNPLFGKVGENKLMEGCDALIDCGFEASSEYGCGTHVHIGVPEANTHREDDELNLRILSLLYTVIDPVFYSLLPTDRRGNRFCNLLTTSLALIDNKTKKPVRSWEEYKRLDMACTNGQYGTVEKVIAQKCRDGISCGGGKYYGINMGNIYRQRHTIEIRYHEGTLNAERLLHWIAFHVAIIDHVLGGNVSEEEVLQLAKIEDIEFLFNELMSMISHRLRDETVDAINERFSSYKKFNPKDGYLPSRLYKTPILNKTRPDTIPSAWDMDDDEL